MVGRLQGFANANKIFKRIQPYHRAPVTKSVVVNCRAVRSTAGLGLVRCPHSLVTPREALWLEGLYSLVLRTLRHLKSLLLQNGTMSRCLLLVRMIYLHRRDALLSLPLRVLLDCNWLLRGRTKVGPGSASVLRLNPYWPSPWVLRKHARSRIVARSEALSCRPFH